jgi:1-deoxy-D-xylulose-5-phosphate synthase
MVKDILNMNKKTYILEDVTKISGLGSSILEFANENDLPTNNIKILGLPDKFIEQGTQEEIYKKYNLDTESIIKTIL